MKVVVRLIINCEGAAAAAQRRRAFHLLTRAANVFILKKRALNIYWYQLPSSGDQDQRRVVMGWLLLVGGAERPPTGRAYGWLMQSLASMQSWHRGTRQLGLSVVVSFFLFRFPTPIGFFFPSRRFASFCSGRSETKRFIRRCATMNNLADGPSNGTVSTIWAWGHRRNSPHTQSYEISIAPSPLLYHRRGWECLRGQREIRGTHFVLFLHTSPRLWEVGIEETCGLPGLRPLEEASKTASAGMTS